MYCRNQWHLLMQVKLTAIEQFEDFIKSLQAENNQLSFDIDIADLQHQLELTDNQNEKLKIQSDIRKKILDNEIKSLEIEKEKAVEETTKKKVKKKKVLLRN